MKNRINKTLIFAASLAATLMLTSSCTKTRSDLTKSDLIPKPVSITATGDNFELKKGVSVYIRGESAGIRNIAEYLAGHLRPATGYPVEIMTAPENSKPGNIWLSLSPDSTKLGDEGYSMVITGQEINLTAKNPAGLFRGVQTIRQLLPAAIELNSVQPGPWKIPTGTITDYPLYSYRGMMLDVSRHFFDVGSVKRLIDQISYYKINALHLGLSNDQGWRIEIKSWPNLATHGGSTQVGGGKGGFFTQEQYTEIVNYAKERYMLIVPEIDMPGHTNAALASYAELNCDGKARDLYTGTDVGFSTLCTRKPVTYKFINDVVGELAALTPGPYIHIGGDESHSTKKEDYIPFMEKVQDIVASHGKQVLAWDEIASAKLRPFTVAQYWSNSKNAAEAVSKGARILMSPAEKAYLDMQYDSTSKFGLHWAAYIEVDDGYNWDPAKLVPGIGTENILGVEAPLWSETIANSDEIEYLVFPRLAGIAEVAWTAPSARDWNEYKIRLAGHGERMKAMGIDFYPSKRVMWKEAPDSRK